MQRKKSITGNLILITGMCLMWIYTALSFVLSPLTGDIKVFLSSAHQASFISSNLLVGSFKVWELKGVFSRFLINIIYNIASIFTPFNSYEFEVVSKIIYLIIIVTLIIVSSLLLTKDLKKIFILFWSISIVVLATHPNCHMQVEMSAILFIFVAFALYISAINKHNKFYYTKLIISGGVVGTLFYYKSILILLGVSVVAAVVAVNETRFRTQSLHSLLIFAAGSFLCIISIAVLIVKINPSEFKDMLYASAYQKTLFSTARPIIDIFAVFCYKLLYNIQFIPFLAVGLAGSFFNTVQNISKSQFKILFIRICMWFFPLLFIIFSNKYFPYHFEILLFPGVIDIFLFISNKPEKFSKYTVTITTIFAVTFFIAKLSVSTGYIKKCIQYDIQSYADNAEFLQSINFDSNASVLYLDDGIGSYYLKNKSHSKYFYPLPLQRFDDNCDLEVCLTMQDEVLTYRGRYISVYETWFFNGNNVMLKNFIIDKYKYIGSYKRFTVPATIPFSAETIKYINFDLYERIED